jgi:hypothetical protein
VLDKAGELDSKFYYFMDWDFWMRAGLYFKIDHITDVLSTYRLHVESKTVAQALKAAPELEYMYNKFFSRTDLPDAIRKVEKKAMMNMYFLTAGYYLKGGDAKTAAIIARKAFKTNPSGVFSFSNLKKFLFSSYSESKPYKFIKKITGKK